VLLAIKNAIGGFIDKILGRGGKEDAARADDVKPGTPMTPEEVVDAVVLKLSEPTVTTDAAQALEEKREQAENLKEQFQPSLPEGKVLKIEFDDASADAVSEDHEVDFAVTVNPKKRGKAPVPPDKVRDEIREKLKSPLLRPGPCAVESVSASNPHSVSAREQREINRIGDLHGDHHSCAPEPGQAEWTGDHQPVTGLVEKAQANPELMVLIKEANLPTTLQGQVLFPHSFDSSKSQGGVVTAITLKLQKLERAKTSAP